MTFEQWFNEMTGFTLRSERFHELLQSDHIHELKTKHYVAWLEAAFKAGQESLIRMED